MKLKSSNVVYNERETAKEAKNKMEGVMTTIARNLSYVTKRRTHERQPEEASPSSAPGPGPYTEP